MAVSDTYVRARIDNTTKERATAALGAMGLSISDAIRLLMLRIADERRLPFEVKVPNAATREAMAELAAGKGTKFASVDALMADLHARSEEHTSELQSVMRISYAVFCLKKKQNGDCRPQHINHFT